MHQFLLSYQPEWIDFFALIWVNMSNFSELNKFPCRDVSFLLLQLLHG